MCYRRMTTQEAAQVTVGLVSVAPGQATSSGGTRQLFKRKVTKVSNYVNLTYNTTKKIAITIAHPIYDEAQP